MSNNNFNLTSDEIYTILTSLRRTLKHVHDMNQRQLELTYENEDNDDAIIDLLNIQVKKNEEQNELLKTVITVFQRRHISHTMGTFKLVTDMVLLSIFAGSFGHIEAVPRRRIVNQWETVWWTITHLNLTDEPLINSDGTVVRESTFKEHYRIKFNTFETLVNILSITEPYRIFDERDSAWPVWTQVAVILWRFSNTHFGYRMAKDKFGCGHGSYNDFTDRFILAMSTVVDIKSDRGNTI